MHTVRWSIRPDVAVHKSIAKWALVNKTFLCDNAVPYRKSADPGLCQGRGGAWDHRRCGTCSVSGPSNASNRPRQLRPGTQAIAIWVCRSHLLLLPAFKALKCSAAASTRHAGHSHCYYRRSKLPFARPQMPKTLRDSFDRQLRPGTQATAICYYRHLSAFEAAVRPPQRPKTRRGSFDQALRPQPSATTGVRGCHSPALKGLKRSAPALTRHAGHSHLLLSAFEAAVCPPSKA